MRYIILVLLSSIILNGQVYYSNIEFRYLVKRLIEDIQQGNETRGLVDMRGLIWMDPKRFKSIVHQYFRNPYESEDTQTLKKYARFIDILVFSKLAITEKEISTIMQDSAITYVFFSSKQEFMDEIEKFNRGFEFLVNLTKENNTKTNNELLALFQANYLLSINQDTKAYEILKQNSPYHTKALQAISYFSSLKDIPLYKNREKLLESIGSKKLKLKDPMFDHKPKFLFDTSGNKVYINYISKEDMQSILEVVKNEADKDMSKKPQKEYIISPLLVRYKDNFVYIQAIPIYTDGEYISTEYIADEVYSLCFEKIDGKWKIIYELTRTDVPSDEQLQEIKKSFPSQFPKNLLSKFWKEMLN